MTWKLILALVVGFCISSAVGAVLVPYLRKIKAGQAIREDGPTWHMSKTGTPTMGGLMFIIAVTPLCFMRARISSKSFWIFCRTRTKSALAIGFNKYSSTPRAIAFLAYSKSS